MSSKPPPEEDINYVLEMWKHPGNLWGLCGALIGGSVAAIATGIAPALLIPVVAQAGLNGIMSLFLPESPVFREAIDRKKRKERREIARTHLIAEVDKRTGDGRGQAARNWETYHRMVEQLVSLQKTAKHTGTDLSLWDVERLDDTTVNYLRLWLARLTITERQAATDVRRIKSRARDLSQRLRGDDLQPIDRNRLQRALADLEKVLERRESFDVQDSAMAAQMLAIADGFSEVYHRIMANPQGDEVGTFLNDAIARMDVGEELDFAADLELEAAIGASSAARSAADELLDEAMREADTSDGAAKQRRKQRS